MVLSLRVVHPDPIKAALDKLAKEFSDSIKMWFDQYFQDTKVSSPNPEQEHHRKVLICGYSEEEDCVCIETSSKWSVCNDIDDDDGVALVCEEEEKSSVEDPLEQSFKNSKEQFIEMDERQVLDAMTTEREGDYEEDDHEEFQAKIDDPNPPVHQVCVESIHDKVISVSHSDFSSPSLSNNTAVGTICANKKGFLVADNIFDKSSERDGYSVELKPKPPDAYNSLNNLIMYGFNATTEPKTKESIYQCLISVAANNQQPSHWFSPYTVHRWEGQVVPHYFSGKLMNHTYMECWNRIAAKYMENPEKRLAVYDSDGLPVGINIDDMTRILHFLDYCGITNSCVAAQNLELREDGYVGLLDLAEDGEFTLLEHSHIVQSVFIDLVLQCNNVPCIDVIIILLVYAVTTGLYHKHYKAAEYGMVLHEYRKETTDAYEVLTSNKKIHFHFPSLQKLLSFLKIAKSVNELMLGERPLVYNDNQFCMGQGYGITNGRWMQWLKMEYFHFDKADVGVTELSDSKSLIFIKKLGSRGINFFGLIVTRFCKKDSDLSSFVNTSLVLINEIHLVNDFCRGALHTIVNRIKVLLLNLGSRLSTPAPALGEETRVVKLNTKGQKSMILSTMVFVRSLDEWVEKKTIEFVKILDNFFTVLMSEKWSSAKLGDVTCLLARHAGANLGMLEIGEHVHSYIRILLEGLNTAACFRVIGMAIIMSSWTQNYGDSSKSKDSLTKFRGAALAIDFNEKIFAAVRFIASRHGVNIVAAVRFGIQLVKKWEIRIEAQGENLAKIIALFKSLRLVFDPGGIMLLITRSSYIYRQLKSS